MLALSSRIGGPSWKVGFSCQRDLLSSFNLLSHVDQASHMSLHVGLSQSWSSVCCDHDGTLRAPDLGLRSVDDHFLKPQAAIPTDQSPTSCHALPPLGPSVSSNQQARVFGVQLSTSLATPFTLFVLSTP